MESNVATACGPGPWYGMCSRFLMFLKPSHFEPGAAPLSRETALTIICSALAAGFVLLLLARGLLSERVGASSFAALADAFLHGRLYIARCPEIDCAVFAGRTYVIFPPLPAVILSPVVALTGPAGFKGAIFIATLAGAVSLLVWRRILAELDVEHSARCWILAAIALTSPLYYVTLKAEGAWFFAQTLAFLFATLAIASVLIWNNLFLAGVFAALGFLCRQMLVFYPLFLLVISFGAQGRLWSPALVRMRAALLVGAPMAVAIGLMMAYNYARFGDGFDTGYRYISNPGAEGFLGARMAEEGLFSARYLVFNLYHLFLQGFHAEFDALLKVRLTGVDWNGTAALVACPWLALAFYMRFDRVAAAGIAVIALIAGITLFYHSSGYAQLGATRYILDWLPVALALMARTERPAAFRALPLLVVVSALMNAAAIATPMLAQG